MSNWITLPQDIAAKHPSYGIKGVAAFLGAISVVLSGLGCLIAVGLLYEIADTRSSLPVDYLLVLPYVIFLTWSGHNAMLLEKKSPAFIRSFFNFLAIGPLISIVTQFIWVRNTILPSDLNQISTGALSIILAWAIWAMIWVPYILYSKRINVTLLNRIRASDPLAKENAANS